MKPDQSPPSAGMRRPEVRITVKGVTIGEGATTVRLSRAEWNEVVRLIKSGTLREA